MIEIPKKYKHREAEERWARQWEDWGIYRYDPSCTREQTFAVDSPPPTVSGSLHVGHVFSYTHQDLLVRYQRMLGKNIAYPMGWDDNGLPTERRVQNVFGIKCNPHLPYDKDMVFNLGEAIEKDAGGKKKGTKEQKEVSRLNFIEACAALTSEDEKVFEGLWRHLGLSIDWTLAYATIDERCRKTSQKSFLDMMAKGRVYHAELPTAWDTGFGTAVAQAEMTDKEIDGKFHDLQFDVEGGGHFIISTTRPELLGACIAVVAHPSDERYQPYFGKTAVTPLYKAHVPILASEHAEPDKGTGILMVCTFGDSADVEYWRKSNLPLRQLIGRDGRILPVDYHAEPFQSEDPDAANAAHAQLAGLFVKQARAKIVELLREAGKLIGEPRPIKHAVKYYEKGEFPLEFVTARQWFVRILDAKEELLAKARQIKWHPEFMRTRIEHWIDGLQYDWCISRQRFFGVPFPVWYRIDDNGTPDYEHPIVATEDMLPVDPMSQAAPGYEESQRGIPGGFMADPDVMDTWATSSLTPQIVSHWADDPEQHAKLFPMDIRPQSHEIIRTWAFYTIVKAWLHDNDIPWKHVIISGWILDPDRKKMSKSKGNVITPEHYLDDYSADAVRYWSSRARLGADTIFEEQLFDAGRKLTTKLFNASRFVISQLDSDTDGRERWTKEYVTEPLDRALLARLRSAVIDATEAFNRFEPASALQTAENEFWDFCDNYVELVKRRSYEAEDTPGRRSAKAALNIALRIFLRLFAPFLPYISEEIWSWRFAASAGRERSVHTSPWPTAEELTLGQAEEGEADNGHGNVYVCATEVLSQIRQSKTLAQKSLRWPVAKLLVQGEAKDAEALKQVLTDVLLAGSAENAEVAIKEGQPAEGARFMVDVTLAESENSAE
ncbi:valine--tRNA ligase [bacterium]|nr:valine--tRNA ligase [bacterium]